MNLQKIAAVLSGLSAAKDKQRKLAEEEEAKKQRQLQNERQQLQWSREDEMYPKRMAEIQRQFDRSKIQDIRTDKAWDRENTRRPMNSGEGPTMQEDLPKIPGQMSGPMSGSMGAGMGIPGISPIIGQTLQKAMASAPSPTGENVMRDIPRSEQVRMDTKSAEVRQRAAEKRQDRENSLADKVKLMLLKEQLTGRRGGRSGGGGSGSGRGSSKKGEDWLNYTSPTGTMASPEMRLSSLVGGTGVPGMPSMQFSGDMPPNQLLVDPTGEKLKLRNGKILSKKQLASMSPRQQQVTLDEIKSTGGELPPDWQAMLMDLDDQKQLANRAATQKKNMQYQQTSFKYRQALAREAQRLIKDEEMDPRLASIEAPKRLEAQGYFPPVAPEKSSESLKQEGTVNDFLCGANDAADMVAQQMNQQTRETPDGPMPIPDLNTPIPQGTSFGPNSGPPMQPAPPAQPMQPNRPQPAPQGQPMQTGNPQNGDVSAQKRDMIIQMFFQKTGRMPTEQQIQQAMGMAGGPPGATPNQPMRR